MGKYLACQTVILLGLISGMVVSSWAAEDEAAKSSPPASATTAADAQKAETEYYQLFSLLADTIDQVERNYVSKLSRRELFEAAIQGILHKLDPYSNYIAPDDITRFRTSVENQFGGIGIQVASEAGALKILSPLVGSPAYREGLQAGDRIVAIEGESTKGLSIDDAVKRLKGEIGTQVKLSVQSPGQDEPRSVTLTREIVHLETVLGDTRNASDQWNFMLEPQSKIGYLRLTGFGRDTASELRQALSKLKSEDLHGLVLDLRFNPGGLLNSAIEVSDLFVSEGNIVSTEGRNTEPRVWEAHSENTFEGFPMAVLVNRFSASSSEIVAACLQDHHRAAIVGERTWGKGSVQNVVELEGGRSALKLTTASYKRPNGKNIHRFPDADDDDEWGVLPDEGLALRLDNDELRQLIEYRRSRDIVRPKKMTVQADETLAKVTEDAEKPKATEDKKDSDSAAPAESAAEKNPASGDVRKPTDGEAATEGKKPADEAKPAEKAPAVKVSSPDEESDSSDERSTSKQSSFVDRQLNMAVEYLKSKLTKPE